MKKILFILFLSFISLSQISCGYSTRSSIPSHIHTLYVEPFKNSIGFTSEGKRNIYLPLLEVKSRNTVIDRFVFDGNLKIVKSGESDLLLKGELKNYERSGLRFTDNDDVQEYRVTITVSLEMWDQTKGEIMWKEPSFSGEATYFVGGPQASSEEDAINRAMTDLANRVVERTVEDW